MLTRRSMLVGLGALAAPAILPPDNLMRLRGIIMTPDGFYRVNGWDHFGRRMSELIEIGSWGRKQFGRLEIGARIWEVTPYGGNMAGEVFVAEAGFPISNHSALLCLNLVRAVSGPPEMRGKGRLIIDTRA